MAGVPIVAGDVGGPYLKPDQSPRFFTMVSGSTKVRIRSQSIMLLGQAVTTGGAINSASLVTNKVRVEGKPVLLAGAITNLETGWHGGTLMGGGAGVVSMG